MRMIGVIGAGACSHEIYELARQVGTGIAKTGAVVVCGGMGGVMEGACCGAYEAGGQTVGILPGPDKAQANPYVAIPIVTDLGHARNVLIVRSSDVLVAISGGKDSAALLFTMVKILGVRRDLMLEAALVDEGIAGYRPVTKGSAEELCRDLGIPLRSRSFATTSDS